MGDIIEVRDLVKRFDDVTAVDGISVDVKEGEVFGFLGPNGAGKTTTIRMLTTLLKPDSGSIRIGGYDVSKDPMGAKSLIGISQQHISLDKDISVYENLRYKTMLLGMSKKDALSRIDELSKLMGLDPYMDKVVSDLSGGWKRKAAIACAVLHKPKILFLDEPTAGLDTRSRHILWEMVRSLKSDGTTVILTTHYIEEAEALCDRIAIVDHGKVVLEGTPNGLCHDMGIWTVEYIDDQDIRRYIYFRERKEATAFLEKCGPSDMSLMRKTHLEDVFLEATGRDNQEEDL